MRNFSIKLLKQFYRMLKRLLLPINKELFSTMMDFIDSCSKVLNSRLIFVTCAVHCVFTSFFLFRVWLFPPRSCAVLLSLLDSPLYELSSIECGVHAAISYAYTPALSYARYSAITHALALHEVNVTGSCPSPACNYWSSKQPTLSFNAPVAWIMWFAAL